MLDKFFGFMKISDEHSVIETLCEHARIDEEEIHFLTDMINELCHDTPSKRLESLYSKVKAVNSETSKLFQHTPDQLIQANFDYQKQYDLLRLYQRNEKITEYIIATAKRCIMINRLNKTLHPALHATCKTLIKAVNEMHILYQSALSHYDSDKRLVYPIINQIKESEHQIDSLHSDCLLIVYDLGNQHKIETGTLLATVNMISHIEDLSDVIDEAAASLEWLLF